MFKRILVPLDGSPLAEDALPVAIRIAEQTNGRLTLLRAVELDPIIMTGLADYPVNVLQYRDLRAAEAVSYLEEIASTSQLNGLSPELMVHDGSAADVVLWTAEEDQADLIIMATHGHKGIRRWALGSVTERVLRYAPCPVLTVRDTWPINHILLMLDGSKCSEAAITPTLNIAQLLSAKVTLFRVDEALPAHDNALDVIGRIEPAAVESIQSLYANQSEAYLAEIKNNLDVSVPIYVRAAVGNPAEEILKASSDPTYDMVAISTHGRRGLHRWVYGSVTEKVLRGVQKPMLVVRPQPKGVDG